MEETIRISNDGFQQKKFSTVRLVHTNTAERHEDTLPAPVVPTRTNLIMVNGRLEKIPRPQNAFMLFANDHRKLFLLQNPGECNSQISTRLGQVWASLDKEKKDVYYQKAKAADVEHKKRYPFYHYTPALSSLQRRKHQAALEELQRPRKISDTLMRQRDTLHSLVQSVNGPGPMPAMVPSPGDLSYDSDHMQVLDPARVQQMISQVHRFSPLHTQALPVRPRRGRPPKVKPTGLRQSAPVPAAPKRGRPRKNPNSQAKRGRPRKTGPRQRAMHEQSNTEGQIQNTPVGNTEPARLSTTPQPNDSVNNYAPHANLSMEVLNVSSQTAGGVGMKLISLPTSSNDSLSTSSSGKTTSSSSSSKDTLPPEPITIQPELDMDEQSSASSDLSIGSNEYGTTPRSYKPDAPWTLNQASSETPENHLQPNCMPSLNDEQTKTLRHPMPVDSKETIQFLDDQRFSHVEQNNTRPVESPHQSGDSAQVYPCNMYDEDSQRYYQQASGYPNQMGNTRDDMDYGYTGFSDYSCEQAGWGEPSSIPPYYGGYGECQSYQPDPYDPFNPGYAPQYSYSQPAYQQGLNTYDNQSSGDMGYDYQMPTPSSQESTANDHTSPGATSEHISEAMRTLEALH